MSNATVNVRHVLASSLLLFAAGCLSAVAGERSRGAACAAIDDATARLACFDAAFPRRAEDKAPAPPAQTGAAAEQTRKFGLSNEQIARIEPRTPEPQVSATTALVKSVRKLPSGYLQVALDNDQIWQQTELDTQIWLRPNDRVTIRRGKLGSFLLETPSRYSTHVRRLQ